VSDLFFQAHATHPDWRMATELVCAQIEGHSRTQAGANFGFIYYTSPFSEYASEILTLLKARTGIADWVGTSATSVLIAEACYEDEPALAVLVGQFSSGSVQVFNGLQRPPPLDTKTIHGALAAFAALVHVDPTSADINELVTDMAAKTESGFVFGGLSSGRSQPFTQIANQRFTGGVSGVMFSSSVNLHTRVTQGCTPLGGEHVITKAQGNYLFELNGKPALEVMLSDLGVPLEMRQSRDGKALLAALPAARLRQGLLLGTSRPGQDKGLGFGDYVVRHVIGIEPDMRVVAVADEIQAGDRLVFCTRDDEAARKDLIRICTELRDEVETNGQTIRGAHYVSCLARSGLLFNGQQSELDVLRHYLGPVPLIGFYANGEIARDRLYSYTGILTVFTAP
jgi:small ligand-binding sensory domain FIST